MNGTTRRQFLKVSATTSTGLATWLALDRAPAFAQKRELTFLSWNHFVPASDDELRRQAEVFSKQANCTVRVDTMAHLQMPAKVAASSVAHQIKGVSSHFVHDAFEDLRRFAWQQGYAVFSVSRWRMSISGNCTSSST